MENTMYPNVHLGKNVEIESPVILGRPPRGKKPGELPLVIGDNAIIRAFTVIYAGVTIGSDFQTGHGAMIREDNIIGDKVSVGTHAVLEFGNRIGNGSRIHSQCFLEMVTIGNHVFVGPNVVFTDDPHPMGCDHYKECKGGANVEDLVKIGAGCIIMPGIRIGKNSLIGGGSVVTKDVSPDMVYAGNPAKAIKSIHELTCPPGFYDRPYMWEPYRNENNEKK